MDKKNTCTKELSAFMDYPPPPPPPKKNEKCFPPISFYQFIRTIAQGYKSGIKLTFTIARVTKMATKIG